MSWGYRPSSSCSGSWACCAATEGLGRVIDNRPILLLWKGRVLDENLRRAHIDRDSLREQLRLAGVANMRDARAVVMERSREMSVIVGQEPVAAHLLEGVIGVPENVR